MVFLGSPLTMSLNSSIGENDVYLAATDVRKSLVYVLRRKVNVRPEDKMILLMVIDANINNHQDPKTTGRA